MRGNPAALLYNESSNPSPLTVDSVVREALLLRFVRLLCFAVLVVAVARAQDSTTGALRGRVIDPGGTAIADAAIILENTHTSRAVNASPDGSFFIPQLPPASYTARITAPGWGTLQIADVVIVLGETREISARLPLLSVSATVNVYAEDLPTSMADTSSSPLQQTIVPREMKELPLDGRRWQDFALLTPNVTGADALSNEISFRGIAAMQNTYELDGFNDTQRFRATPRGGTHALRVPQSAVREFRIQAANASATYGFAAGGSITAVTYAGDRRRAGSAFLQSRSNLFAAVDPSAIYTRYNNGLPTVGYAKPQDLRLQWGATSGGPILLRRGLFYHLSYEQQRRNFPAISSPASAQFYKLSATQAALLQTRGVTLAQIRSALAYIDSLSGQVDRHDDELSLLSRMDWQPALSHQLTLAWSHMQRNAPAGLRPQTVVARGASSFGNDHIVTDAVNLRWTQTASAAWMHQFGIGFSRDFECQQAQSPLAQEPHTGPNGFSPQVSIGSDFTFGKPATLNRRRYPDERRAQIFDTLTWSHHASLLQIGVSASAVDERISSLQNEEGTYIYANSTASGRAGALVDWITDYTFSSSAYPNGACPSIYAVNHYFCFRSFTQSFGGTSTGFRTAEFAAFVQNRWQATPSLTIDAGIRYELPHFPAAQHPNTTLNALFGDEASTDYMPRDANNIAPQAAIAWSPGEHKTVIRLSYGLTYGRVPGATLWSALTRTALPETVKSVHLTPQTILSSACASSGSNFGYPSTYICTPSSTTLRTTSAVLFANNFQLPSVQQARLSIEHQVGAYLLSATYLNSAARQLPNSTDLNIAPASQTSAFRIVRNDNRGETGVRNGDSFVIPLYTARINYNYGPVTAILSNASASHNSVTLAARRGMRRGLSLRGSWTYGKTLDFGQNHSALPRTIGQLDPFDVRYDHAVSELDRRHRVIFSSMIEPTLHGDGTLRAFTNDWTLAMIFTASSGRPYSYLITGGTSLSGGGYSVNGSGGLRYLPTVGRNTLRLPWSELLNLHLSKRIPLNEHLRTRIYADIFNVLNANNPTRVQQRAFLVGDQTAGITPLVFQDAATVTAEGLTTQPFGTRLGSGTLLARQREFQFGMRVEW